MREFVKPIIVISKCLGFARCRYDGLIIPDDFVEKLESRVDFRPVCPELEIGLGVPRDPIRVVSTDGGLRLVQPSTNLDVSEEMRDFANSFLNSITEVDGFILKSRSPSCGIKDVNVYSGAAEPAPASKGAGFFGGAVLERFPDTAIEDEGRLRSFNIRKHFLTKLFALSSFRRVRDSNSMKELVQFHSENKLLFMAYNKMKIQVLSRIVANTEKKPIDRLIRDYQKHLLKTLSKTPKYTSNIVQQAFFEPYLEELMDITDSGKGRDL